MSSVLDPTAFEREIAPLSKIHDNYPKYIITMDEFSSNNDGIKQINLVSLYNAKKQAQEPIHNQALRHLSDFTPKRQLNII